MRNSVFVLRRIVPARACSALSPLPWPWFTSHVAYSLHRCPSLVGRIHRADLYRFDLNDPCVLPPSAPSCLEPGRPDVDGIRLCQRAFRIVRANAVSPTRHRPYSAVLLAEHRVSWRLPSVRHDPVDRRVWQGGIGSCATAAGSAPRKSPCREISQGSRVIRFCGPGATCTPAAAASLSARASLNHASSASRSCAPPRRLPPSCST